MSPLEWSHLGLLEFPSARATQERLAAARAEGRQGDRLLTLEHPPLWTLGRRASLARERALRAGARWPVLRTDRGGDVTFHGPGQLVVYPVFRLSSQGRGVRHFVAALEEALIDTAAAFGVATHRRCGAPGIWAKDGRKLASIGIAVRRGVTLHGAALNLDMRSESGFLGIDPCGMPGVEMSSLESESGRPGPSAASAAAVLAAALAERLGRRLLRVGDAPCGAAALTAGTASS